MKHLVAAIALLCVTACETAPAPQIATEGARPAGDAILLPVWAEKGPGPNDYLSVYPERARRMEVESGTMLDCVIRPERTLDCTVAWEEYPDLGFGAAALKVAALFVVRPEDQEPYVKVGQKVRLPIRFTLG